MDTRIQQYVHHGRLMSVRADLKGKHREYCLCYSCAALNLKDRNSNCSVANTLFSLGVLAGITTPVWECVRFVAAEGP